jgi:hypothetical protein
MFIRDLRAQSVHLVIAARNANQFGAVNLCAQNLRRLKIRRNKHPCFEPVARRLRRYRICQVARRRTRHGVEAEAARLRQRHRNYTVLEAKGGQTDGVILDEEVPGAQARG